jgi:predicted MFS family arabinose efflux permease
MTIASGLCVANIYYCQPLLELIHASLGGTTRELGLIPTLTQVGYALGMLFLIPLGDMGERKKLILFFTLLSAAALFLMAAAKTLLLAILASLFLGLATMTPHLIVPFIAHLAPPERRGEMVGTVVSGILVGILGARTIAGFLGTWLGWRATFAIAGVTLCLLAFALAELLPKSEPTFQGSYLELLRSIGEIFFSQPVLREASLFGATLFGAFSAFWANLIFLMASNFHRGAMAVGLFGLLGAAGALGVPLFGRLADGGSPRRGTGFAILATALSFLAVWKWGGSSLLALGLGVVLMDLGVQGAQITNQTRIFKLLPEARSRLNTAYMFSYFAGGALGSWAGTLAWSYFRWSGVCGVCLGFCAIAGVIYGRGEEEPTPAFN